MELHEAAAHLAVARQSLPQAIYLVLREAILRGACRPGDALRQEALAKQFDASRVPVREALNRLEAEGLVVLRPRRGFVVASLDLGEVEEIFQLREVLEEHAGQEAAAVRTAKDVDAVGKLLQTMEELKFNDPSDVVAWSPHNRAFHARLFAASGKYHLCHAVNTYRDMVERYIRIEVSMTGHFERAQHEHRDIFAAFVKGDADTVGRLSREHCAHTAARLIAAIRAREGADGAATVKE